jgi:GNAT superfamily N-acetyltransferase
MLIRPATMDEVPALNALIVRSARALSEGFYTPEQTDAVTREVFGVDTQLVRDATYYAVEEEGVIVACGGWSQRGAVCGGDGAKMGDDRLLDPARDAARIRAFFVDPGHARRGIGRALLQHCAAAAANEGFTRLELIATLPGAPLYAAAGFVPGEHFELQLSSAAVPVIRMHRAVAV